jgi:valyl-tRNA synthetase
MSKSLGNGIDPLEVVQKYGADTLRFMLITGNTPGNDMRFYWNRIEAVRNFANKIWNATRFALMNMDGYDPKAKMAPYTLADKWILSRLQEVITDVTNMLGKFELGEAGRIMYDFIWNELCDWYIEIAKPRLYGKDTAEARATAQHVLLTVLTKAMQLLHPYMPFITEEIYHALPHDYDSIMISPWPKADAKLLDKDAVTAMTAIMEAVKGIRNMRAEVNAVPSKKIPAIILVVPELMETVTANKSYLELLGAISELTILPAGSPKPENAMAAVTTGIEVYLPLAGLIDVAAETARLNKELASLEKDLARTSGKLKNKGFLAKAPADVVAKEQAKSDEFNVKIKSIKERLDYLQTIK